MEAKNGWISLDDKNGWIARYGKSRFGNTSALVGVEV